MLADRYSGEKSRRVRGAGRERERLHSTFSDLHHEELQICLLVVEVSLIFGKRIVVKTITTKLAIE
jgi:hypothetical protein